jgi:drug/metabolite transporter (DMT)-like permease
LTGLLRESRSTTDVTQAALTPLALAVGILAVSTASILIRHAQAEVPSLVIAAARLAIATIVVAPLAAARHRAALAGLGGRDLGLAALAGVFLALHFATWIASLEHTSVVSSVVLVTTTPLWVALLAPLVLGERLTRAILAGLGLALAGGVLVAWSGAAPHGGRHALRGDLLALAGAWMMCGYLLVGRRLRARLALVPYVTLVYGMAAVVLVLAAGLAGHRVARIPAAAWPWLLALALVPQLVGHTTFNWALRHLPASLVAIALLGEPVGSAALAWALLGERPGALEAAGAALILAGIALAARAAPEPGAEAAT